MRTESKCHICGNTQGFKAADGVVVSNDMCCECGASIRNSDMAHIIVKYFGGNDECLTDSLELLENKKILNIGSDGPIHDVLKKLDMYIKSDSCQSDFAEGYFDLVLSEDIFGNADNTDVLLKKIDSVLSERGVYIFSESSAECEKNLMKELAGKSKIWNLNSNIFVMRKSWSSIDEFSGERFVPGIEDQKLAIEHIQRYQSILPLVKGKCVIDIACGEGYGTEILAAEAEKIIGADICEEAIFRATQKYKKDNLKYMVGDISKIPLPDSSVDVVVSFETIEHVDEELQKKFLDEIKRVLRTDGILVMSTPNKEVYSDRYHYFNEYHIKEFYHDEYINFLNTKFQYIKLYNQAFEVVSLLTGCDAGEKSIIYNGEEEYSAQGKYYIAIASNKEIDLPDISSAFVYKMGEYEECIQRIVTLQNEEERRNVHIHRLDEEIKRKGELIHTLQQEEEQRNSHICSLDREIHEQRNLIQMLQREKEWKEEQIEELEQTARNKEAHIELLLEKERTYERERNTHSYKLALKFQKVFDCIFPINSKRRFFVRITYNIFRHPQLMLHVVNPKRIKSYIKYIKKEGMEGVNKRYDEAVGLERVKITPNSNLDLDILDVASKRQKGVLPIESYERIVFKSCSNPLVSIIIPVYNEFDYTYNCLKAIWKNTENVNYEIIIANDCSADNTKEIEQIVKNIKLITTEENVRFLLNCNNAAQHAKGKYILFLNNDTQVQAGWLETLVSLIENDEKVGMVGSKLVYADGRLQEAGGIFWKDGSAWNYGNRQPADSSEFNYIKEVDYISGAAIMIRSSLWKEIGGFDERFVPAYCEDSDLAFEVRKHGYKVVYQPLSVVVHFEGVSNGTDLASGQKAYQVVNQKKFLEKWGDVLQREHFSNGEKVFVARDRSREKPVILMVDHYVPQYDKDAGSRTVYQYLRLFVKKGFNVKFIGDNFYRHEPYTTKLQQMGIEVLYGAYYAQHWKEWIEENAEYIQYVFLNRPHVSVKYIDFIRKKTEAKIVYYGHDLHFLREQRNYELTKDKSVLAESQKWKEKEFRLMQKADVVYYPSEVEIAEIAKTDAQINAKAIVAYMFENIVPEDYCFDKRKDIMFIGGFVHTPNIDAVLWFATEVFPIVKEQIPDIKFYILGSHPTNEIQELEDDNILVKGFVSDEELEHYYKMCRLSVVPLRYGAGIKGKVIEAMSYGIPVVTTSVGAEGIAGAEEILCIADSADKLSAALCRLYCNEEELREMSKASYQYIQDNFSEKNAWEVVAEDFQGNRG